MIPVHALFEEREGHCEQTQGKRCSSVLRRRHREDEGTQADYKEVEDDGRRSEPVVIIKGRCRDDDGHYFIGTKDDNVTEDRGQEEHKELDRTHC
jgi:hypothetical protein